MNDLSGPREVSRLLDGETDESVNLVALPAPYDALALAIYNKSEETDTLETFESELARLTPVKAAQVRAAVRRAQSDRRDASLHRKRGYWADELLNADLPPLCWLIEGLIIRPGLTILGGAPKVGKSWLSLQMAHAVTTGDLFLDKPVNETGSVLYYALEDGAGRMNGRIQKTGWTGDEQVRFLFNRELPPLDREGMAVLEWDIRDNRPVLVIIDSLAAAKSSRVDENDGGQMAEVMYGLSRMCTTYSLAMLLVHHHRKSATGSPMADLRGSGALGAAADSILALYRERGEKECKLGFDSRDAEGGDWTLGFTGSGWQLLGDGEMFGRKQVEHKLARALETVGEGALDEIIEAVPGGVNRTAAYKGLLALVGQQLVHVEEREPEGRGRRKRVYRLAK